MPSKKSEEKKKAEEQRGPVSANVSMANTKAPQASPSSSLDTQPPVWFLREMEKITEVRQNTFAARLNQIDVSIEKLEGGLKCNTDRVTQLEQTCTELQQSLTSLHQDYDELAENHTRRRLNSGRSLTTRRIAKEGAGPPWGIPRHVLTGHWTLICTV